MAMGQTSYPLVQTVCLLAFIVQANITVDIILPTVFRCRFGSAFPGNFGDTG